MREACLFTFAHSPKHVGLYEKFGFWPRFLTAIMSKGVSGREASSIIYSALNEGERDQALRACCKLTGSIYEGLDVKPDEALALSSLQPSDQARGRRMSSNIYWTPAKRSQLSAACNEWKLALTLTAAKPIARCCDAVFALIFKVLRCTSPTHLPIIARTPLSWTTGARPAA